MRFKEKPMLLIKGKKIIKKGTLIIEESLNIYIKKILNLIILFDYYYHQYKSIFKLVSKQ